MTDYLSSNALLRYPFQDNASLIAVDTTTLPDDTFLDIVFASKRADAVGAFLYSYTSDGTTQFTIVFNYFNEALTTLGTLTMTIPFGSVVLQGFYGQANSDVAVKIVFGQQFIVDKGNNVTHVFTLANSLVAQSAFILMVPRVTSFAFYNWDKESNDPDVSPVVTISGNESSPQALNLLGGANTSFALSQGSAAISIAKGSGTGLYDVCGDGPLTINEINSLGPDSNQNFQFVTDDCYTTSTVTVDGNPAGLSFDNICTPKCTTEQLDAFTYYLNRVINGMDYVISTTVTGLYNEMSSELASYNTSLSNVNIPYRVVKFLKLPTVDSGRYYYSFAIGYFNATTEPLDLSVTLATTGDYFLTNSFKFSVDNATTIFDTTTFTGSVPCLKVGILEFVVSSQESNTVTITSTFGTYSWTDTATIN